MKGINWLIQCLILKIGKQLGQLNCRWFFFFCKQFPLFAADGEFTQRMERFKAPALQASPTNSESPASSCQRSCSNFVSDIQQKLQSTTTPSTKQASRIRQVGPPGSVEVCRFYLRQKKVIEAFQNLLLFLLVTFDHLFNERFQLDIWMAHKKSLPCEQERELELNQLPFNPISENAWLKRSSSDSSLTQVGLYLYLNSFYC